MTVPNLLGSSQSLAEAELENVSTGSEQVRGLGQHSELDGRVGVDFGVGGLARLLGQQLSL